MAKALGHSNPSQRTKPELIEFILNNKKGQKPILEFISKNKSILIPIVLFVLAGSLALWIRSNPKDILDEVSDKIQIPISVLVEPNGTVISMTQPRINKYNPDDFKYYGKSLSNIESFKIQNSFYGGIEKELGVNLPKTNKTISMAKVMPRDIVENAFWTWLTFPENSYYWKNVGISAPSVTSNLMNNIHYSDDPEKQMFCIVPFVGNDLLEINKKILTLPKKSKIELKGQARHITTPEGKIIIHLSQSTTTTFTYAKENLINNIFHLFNLDKTKKYKTLDFVLNISLDARESTGDNEDAVDIRDWFNRINEIGTLSFSSIKLMDTIKKY